MTGRDGHAPCEDERVHPVMRSTSRRLADEGAYVLTALEIPFRHVRERGAHVLLVAPEEAARASSEIVAYLREDGLTPSDLVEPARRGRPLPGAVVYAAIAVLVFGMATARAFGVNWFDTGMVDSVRMADGEWWRPITALTLHDGLDHIVSNLVFGAFFGALLAEACGSGLAWSMVVASGALGNVLNVMLRDGHHRAVGASTAIFGALGALAAHEWVRGWTDARDVARRWAPLVGGVILLGFLGLGGENTDVLAHVTGFGVGSALGIVAARWRVLRRLPAVPQAALAVLAVAAVVAAWAAAIVS